MKENEMRYPLRDRCSNDVVPAALSDAKASAECVAMLCHAIMNGCVAAFNALIAVGAVLCLADMYTSVKPSSTDTR